MKDGLRFVDCDMHIMEPPDLFEKYLDPKFKDRVILPVGADGRPRRGMIIIDDQPNSMDAELQQHRKRAVPGTTRQHAAPVGLAAGRTGPPGLRHRSATTTPRPR